MGFMDKAKGMLGNAKEKAKEKFQDQTIGKVTKQVTEKLFAGEDMPEFTLEDGGEEKIKKFVSEKAADLVKEEVEKQTSGQFKELTDIIVEKATEKVVNVAVEKIKEKLSS